MGLKQRVHKFWQFGAGHMALAAFCAHSVSISIGISQGYSAILLPQLEEDPHFLVVKDSEEESWLASLGAVTNPIGSILSGVFAEYFGRKRSIQISSVPFLIGWLCIGFATDINWLYAGRLITGIAAGMSTACYTYVSEISTPENRGIFQALGPICASFGILFTYVCGYLFDWKIVSFISLFFGLFSMISIQFLPESPGYLLRKNEETESFNVYLWFRRNNAEAQEEIDKYNNNNKKSEKDKIELRDIYFGPQTVKPFLILVTLFFLQEMSGIYTILFYAVNFFEEANIDLDKYVASIVVGVIRFTVSIVAAILINKYGRKVLCIGSNIGMTLSMVLVAGYVKYYELNQNEEKVFPVLPLLGVILNVFFSMIGMLPIPWILTGEMFPLEVRPIMSGIVICIAQTFIFICVKIYTNLLQVLNFSGTLFLFSFASVLALFFCKFILFETKNKSLQDIERHFKKTSGELKGFDNKGFVISPDTDPKSGHGIYRVEIDD
ncbi:facilitated trehalose transporter Tret1 isoform X3 [Aethina tumida]|nr:facilitated trehalose transporter Tret1 isoform X3 [Aethina tumida]XP_019876120.2 facilitated trehalose transporter Tret1 isoform X3 [Aethina tumida]